MFAAAGGDEQRAYPWSEPPNATAADCSQANFGGDDWPTTACVAAGARVVGAGSPEGDGRWGHADLGGNAFEWVLDWYHAQLKPSCNDCADLAPAQFRGLRGGSLRREIRTVRVGYRGNDDPTLRLLHFGARCARPAG